MKNLPEAADIEQGSEEEREFFRLLDESVSYSFLENTSQITAAVSVLNDEQLAAHLLDSINSTLPAYITDWLQTDPSIEVEFRLLYDINCRLLNPHQWVTEGIKYGALLGLAALVIACVAVVVVDRTDTRLRDYHKVAQKFNLPGPRRHSEDFRVARSGRTEGRNGGAQMSFIGKFFANRRRRRQLRQYESHGGSSRKAYLLDADTPFAITEAFRNLKATLSVSIPRKEDGRGISILATSTFPKKEKRRSP